MDAHPFVPAGQDQLRRRRRRSFKPRSADWPSGWHIGTPPTSIGISGGLDSTLALLVACRTMDALGVPRSRIKALTMPGFGTTSRTLANARALMKHLGVTAHEADIRALCFEEMKALKHVPFGISLDGLTVESLTAKLRALHPDNCNDLVFENVQARMRTSLLMNAGFVIGTGDLSEAALGWCTYNGDHMSMYNPTRASKNARAVPGQMGAGAVRWRAAASLRTSSTVIRRNSSTTRQWRFNPRDEHRPVRATRFLLYHFLGPPRAAEDPVPGQHANFHATYTPAESAGLTGVPQTVFT